MMKLQRTINNHIRDNNFYKLISSYYGIDCTNRSQIPLMNHIDEGILILEDLNADYNAIIAYCIHPLCQSDDMLVNYFLKNGIYNQIQPNILLLALEYRKTANSYLHHNLDVIRPSDVIRLSPLDDVNNMLIADKIQNYKDFLIYHYGTHEQSDKLNQYFINWLTALGVYSNFEYYKNLLK